MMYLFWGIVIGYMTEEDGGLFSKDVFHCALSQIGMRRKAAAMGTLRICMGIGRKRVILGRLREKKKTVLIIYTLILEFG